MFEVEILNGRPQRLFEAESEIFVELAGSSHYSTVFYFRMKQHDFQITFGIRSGHADDPTTGEEYSFSTFVIFGGQPGDSPEADFKDPEIEHFWKLKAAAALVVVGSHYNGLEYPPERFRVLLDGRLYTRLDLGYST